MSDLTLTLLRFSFLVLLWLLVLGCIAVIYRDVYGTRLSLSRRTRAVRRAAAAAAAAAGSSGGQSLPDGAAHPARSAPVTLVVTAGPLAGAQMSLHTSAVLIGRSPSCTLVLDDDVVSSRHARIFPHDGGWYLEDLGSTNGTWVEGRRVGDAEPLVVGQSVTIGTTVLELRGAR